MRELPVLVVAPDDHAFRMLDVTLRLVGFTSVPRRSVDEARKLRPGDHRPRAVVVDGTTLPAADEVSALVEELRVPVVVVLREGREQEREVFEGAGARVIVGDFDPDELHDAIAEAS